MPALLSPCTVALGLASRLIMPALSFWALQSSLLPTTLLVRDDRFPQTLQLFVGFSGNWCTCTASPDHKGKKRCIEGSGPDAVLFHELVILKLHTFQLKGFENPHQAFVLSPLEDNGLYETLAGLCCLQSPFACFVSLLCAFSLQSLTSILRSTIKSITPAVGYRLVTRK